MTILKTVTLLLLITVNIFISSVAETHHCSIKDKPNVNRPDIKQTKSILVSDFDKNGILDGLDIQDAINNAAILHKKNKETYVVQLNGKQKDFNVFKPIILKSGVFLNGASKRIIAKKATSLIKFKPYAKVSGVWNTVFLTNNKYNANGTAVSIGEGAKNLYIYNNKFQDEIKNLSDLGSGSGSSMIMLNKNNIKDIFIDGNSFFHVSTGITIRSAIISSVVISNNIFSTWRQRAIYVLNDSRSDINLIKIVKNRINEPKTGAVRQPIAFQNSANTFIRNVSINYNEIFSSDKPHIWEYRVTSTGKQYRHTMFNNATADLISLHGVKNFQVVGNCLYNGGESGIITALGTHDGNISSNYLSNIDVAAISVGAGIKGKDKPVYDIRVNSNIIVNPSRSRYEGLPKLKRQNTAPEWARSGISFTNANDCYANNNLIIENTPRYNEKGESLTLLYGFYERESRNIVYGKKNIMKTPPYVVNISKFLE